MSAKKSWDVVSKRRPAASAAPVPAAPRAAGVRKPAWGFMRKRPTTRRSRLRERRRQERKRWWRLLLIAALILLALGAYGLWRPELRIQSIQVQGPNAEQVKRIAEANFVGTYGSIVPHDSIFFFPQKTIRDSVLVAFPHLSAVSLKRTSFTSITILSTPRVAAMVWCGASYDTPVLPCFKVDSEGLVFAPLIKEDALDTAADVLTEEALSTATSTEATPWEQPQTSELIVFGPLNVPFVERRSVVGAHLESASFMPDAIRFVKAIREMGVPVTSFEIVADEANLWVTDATHITYVLGSEQEAAELAASVLPTLDLEDGTIQYLDLRFSGRAYVKRYGED